MRLIISWSTVAFVQTLFFQTMVFNTWKFNFILNLSSVLYGFSEPLARCCSQVRIESNFEVGSTAKEATCCSQTFWRLMGELCLLFPCIQSIWGHETLLSLSIPHLPHCGSLGGEDSASFASPTAWVEQLCSGLWDFHTRTVRLYSDFLIPLHFWIWRLCDRIKSISNSFWIFRDHRSSILLCGYIT